MDSCVPFPKEPSADIERIVNLNQDGDAWVVRRKLDQDLIVQLVRGAKESDIVVGPTENHEEEFRAALGTCSEFRAVNNEGEAEWVPAGYPNGNERRKLSAYWVSLGKPVLTSLQFVKD